jgi:hypothetical protein
MANGMLWLLQTIGGMALVDDDEATVVCIQGAVAVSIGSEYVDMQCNKREQRG